MFWFVFPLRSPRRRCARPAGAAGRARAREQSGTEAAGLPVRGRVSLRGQRSEHGSTERGLATGGGRGPGRGARRLAGRARSPAAARRARPSTCCRERRRGRGPAGAGRGAAGRPAAGGAARPLPAVTQAAAAPPPPPSAAVTPSGGRRKPSRRPPLGPCRRPLPGSPGGWGRVCAASLPPGPGGAHGLGRGRQGWWSGPRGRGARGRSPAIGWPVNIQRGNWAVGSGRSSFLYVIGMSCGPVSAAPNGAPRPIRRE